VVPLFSEKSAVDWWPISQANKSSVCSFVGTRMMTTLASFPSLFGGIVLRDILTPLLLASSCESVGDVLALLIYSRAGFRVSSVVVGSVVSIVGVLFIRASHHCWSS
jgi:hypothetical protein